MLVDRRQVAHDHAAAQQVDPRGRRGVARNRKGLKRTACYEGVLIARAFGVAPSAPAGPRGCGRANRECGCWSAPAVRHARGASRSAHPRARAWSSTWVRALQKGRATQQVTKSRVAVCRSFAVACQRRRLAQLGLILCVCASRCGGPDLKNSAKKGLWAPKFSRLRRASGGLAPPDPPCGTKKFKKSISSTCTKLQT